MFRRFLPKETNFFDFFEQHALLLIQAAQELFSFFDHYPSSEIKLAERLKALEHQADEIVHHCVEALHQTFITPFERDDIYRLISQMDDVIDYIEGTGACIAIYQLKEIKESAKELASLLVQATQELEKAVKGLRSLGHPTELKGLLRHIYQIENQADEVVMQAVGLLFSQEVDTRELIKWKEIYENLETAIDRCQDVANVMEGVVLEYS